MIATVEQYLAPLLAQLAPYATTGVLIAALVVAANRLPILSIGAMVAACACLGAFLSTGNGGMEAGMSLAIAGGVCGLILLLSGGQLWQRPALRPLLRARGPNRERQTEDGGQTTATDARTEDRGRTTATNAQTGDGSLATGRPDIRHPLPSTLYPVPSALQSIPFRLVATVVLALAAETFAHNLALPIAPQEQRLGIWLALLGAFAGLSAGNAIVSASGFVILLAAAELVVPDLISDPALRPSIYGAIAAIIIVIALGFSFAARLPRPQTGTVKKEEGQA